MAASLDMTLDERMRSRGNRQRGRGQGGPPRGRGAGAPFSSGRMMGAVRRGPLSVNARPSAYAIAKSMHRTKRFPWQHDLFEDSLRAAGISGIEVGTKLYVSNLDRGVTNEDIRELFAEIGELKRYAIHYDKNGRPSGSAEVVYTRRSDAFSALKRYNNVQLDGRPMKIEILGANADIPVSARVNVTGMNGRRRRTVVMNPPSGPARVPPMVNRGSRWNYRGGQRGARGRGRRGGWGPRGKRQPIEKSADELDKELENYHAEAMQT